jgi:hypothetical protein
MNHRATPRQSAENRFGGIGDGVGARLPLVEPPGQHRVLIDIETWTAAAGDQLVAGRLFDLSSDPLNLN